MSTARRAREGMKSGSKSATGAIESKSTTYASGRFSTPLAKGSSLALEINQGSAHKHKRVSTLLRPLDSLANPSKNQPHIVDADGDNTKIGGEEVLFYNDPFFSKVRARYHVDKNCVSTREQFDWSCIKPSLGKGGDAMGFSSDGRYIVKELGSDHEPLVNITRDYVKHVCGDSFLVRFLFHFWHPVRGKNYVVMNSWTPKTPKELQKTPDDMMELYDLKGCADDKAMIHNYKRVLQVHRRCWHCCADCPCVISEERRLYRNLKREARVMDFPIQWEEKKRIMSKLQSDAQCLRRHGLMDYSLIIGVKRCEEERFKREILSPRGGFLPGDDGGRDQVQPYYAVHKKGAAVEVIGYYLGIIDFLQPWTCGKKIAHQIKCCDRKPLATVIPSEYGTRFEDYFEGKFKVDPKTPAPAWLLRSREISAAAAAGLDALSQVHGASKDRTSNGEVAANTGDIHLSGINISRRDAEQSSGYHGVAETGQEKGDDEGVSPVKQIAAGALMFASAAAIAAIEYTAMTAASGGV